jgi:hypothetical protein
MKLNTNLIIGAALLGGGAYYAYAKGWFGKKRPPIGSPDKAIAESQETLDRIAAEQAAATKKAVITSAATKIVTAANAITNANSYKGKVAYIQSDLGVAVDGIAGNQTNMAYNAKYGLDKGNISDANVDYYQSKVKQGLTLSKQAQVAKQTNGVAIVNALKNGGSIRFIKAVNAQNFVLNKATNSYAATGTNLLFNNGAVLSSSWRAVDRGAGFVLIYKMGATTLQQVPVNAIVVV